MIYQPITNYLLNIDTFHDVDSDFTTVLAIENPLPCGKMTSMPLMAYCFNKTVISNANFICNQAQ